MAKFYFAASRLFKVLGTVYWALGAPPKARRKFAWLAGRCERLAREQIIWQREQAAAKEAAERERKAALEAAEKERIAKQELEYQREMVRLHKERERQLERILSTPNINTTDWDIHRKRLQRHGYSRYRGETEFMGPRGGIYTITASGNRNYR